MRPRNHTYHEPTLGWSFGIFLLVLYFHGILLGMWLYMHFLD